MSESIFDVLKDYSDLYNLAKRIENNINLNISYDEVLKESKLYADKLIREVARIEEYHFKSSDNYLEIIKILSNENIIDSVTEGLFYDIATIEKLNTVKNIKRIHGSLYGITKWFIYAYIETSNSIPKYKEPKIYLESDEKLKRIESEDDNEIDGYKFEKLKGSYLLNELSKLSASSNEVIDSLEERNYFKRYLHVDRTIQEELLEVVRESANTDKSQLILLCGSVGDGKSHLLSYLIEEYSDLLSKFEFHNDATESYSPKLTELETLEQVLKDFNDENIDKSNKKLILAINLGVLNNFIENDSTKENYKLLKSFIDDSKVFNQDELSENYNSETFKLVNFGDYSLYELTEEGPCSDYIDKILKKITEKDSENPFYKAYLKDVANYDRSYNSMMINYEILSIDSVRERIIYLIIKSLIKSKKILSTRDLLIFIYDLLVPSNFKIDDINCNELLPNIIFTSNKKGELLKILVNEDPIDLRFKYIDDLAINLNLSNDFNEFISKYFDLDMSNIINLAFQDSKETKSGLQEKLKLLIRFIYICGKDKNIIVDKYYDQYMKYLYHFNIGNISKYSDLFSKVEKLIYSWNGFMKNNYIFLDKKLKKFDVAEHINLNKSKQGCCQKRKDKELNRFKKNIIISFEFDNKQYESLEIDYQLYEKIQRIYDGYCVTKNDKEEAVRFVEFMDRIIPYGSMSEEVIIKEKSSKNLFSLCYDDFDEEFKFRREN